MALMLKGFEKIILYTILKIVLYIILGLFTVSTYVVAINSR